MAFLGGLFDPPAAQVIAPQTWQNQPGMDTASAGALGGISNLSNFNTAGQTLGQYGDITQNLINNPYAGGYIGGSGMAGGMSQGGGVNAFQAGNGLYSMGGQIAQTAFDPQNALYNRTQQQLMDQTRAGQAARGVAMTPYGAGMEDQQNRNFNIDWQNNQLQRQLQGAQGASGAFQGGMGLQQGGSNMYAGGSAMPYNAYQQVGQGQQGALQNFGQFGQQASAIPQQQVQDWLNYIGQGNQANAVAQTGFANQLKQSQLANDQQQGMFSGLGSAIGSVAPYAMMAFSDIRLKEDVEPVGELYDGQPLYAYRYKGDPEPRIGLMAHEVERVRPDAVFEVGGYKAVDYGRATEHARALAGGANAFSRW